MTTNKYETDCIALKKDNVTKKKALVNKRYKIYYRVCQCV